MFAHKRIHYILYPIANKHAVEVVSLFCSRSRGNIDVKSVGYCRARLYFDIKEDMAKLESMFSESNQLEDEIRSQLKCLKFEGVKI